MDVEEGKVGGKNAVFSPWGRRSYSPQSSHLHSWTLPVQRSGPSLVVFSLDGRRGKEDWESCDWTGKAAEGMDTPCFSPTQPFSQGFAFYSTGPGPGQANTASVPPSAVTEQSW